MLRSSPAGKVDGIGGRLDQRDGVLDRARTVIVLDVAQHKRPPLHFDAPVLCFLPPILECVGWWADDDGTRFDGHSPVGKADLACDLGGARPLLDDPADDRERCLGGCGAAVAELQLGGDPEGIVFLVTIISARPDVSSRIVARMPPCAMPG